MSTRFTNSGAPMTDSQALRLVLSTAAVHEKITEHVADKLKEKGYIGVSPSVLTFLSALDCGVNYGSEIARRLKVTRQMVAKTVKELCRIGYLKQITGPGKQKQILYTASGEKLIAEVRQLLAEMDKTLYKKIGKATLDEIILTLDTIHALTISTDKSLDHQGKSRFPG